MKYRPILLRWHRWFGLGAALWLLLLALTGSFIVFNGPFDRWINPDLLRSRATGPSLPFSRLYELAAIARPDARIMSVALDRSPGSTAMVLLGSRPAGRPIAPGTQMFIDPHTGRILGQRVPGDLRFDRHHLPSLIYGLHVDWLLGPWMTYFLGWVALLWIIDHVVGIVLAAGSAKKFVSAFLIRWRTKGHRRLFDLHRASGLWMFPVTLAIAVTGLSLTWYDDFAGVVGRISPLTPFPTQLRANAPTHAERRRIGIDAAIAAARIKAGGGAPAAVAAYPDQGIYWFHFYDKRDLDEFPGRWITVDMATGDVVQDRHITQGSSGDTFMAWQLPLHSGKVFGWPGRIIIFLTGVMLCGMIITGLTIWRRKSISRTVRSARAAS